MNLQNQRSLRPNDLKFNFLNQTLYLLPEKAIWWEESHALIVSDIHFSKAGHFRKEGIHVPTEADEENYKVLDKLIDDFSPEQLLVLGDMIHSGYNHELERFCIWRENKRSLNMLLVAGNHDILDKKFYSNCNIQVVDDWVQAPFLFTHKPLKKNSSSYYNLSGHIHPSVNLIGNARQTMRLPCFFFGENYGLLPAFGAFTGKAKIGVKKEDMVFVIAGDKVCQIS